MPKKQPIGPFKAGMDNRSDETSLRQGTARQLRNVDVDKDGNVALRRGFQQLLSGQELHSLFSAQTGKLYGVVGSMLGLFDIYAPSFTGLVQMPNKYRTDYTELNGTVYASNPAFSCRFKPATNSVYTIGVPLVDTVASMFAAADTGGLHEGTYTVGVTVVDEFGEESGFSPEYPIEVAQGGGISIVGLPIIAGSQIRVYSTMRNGEEFYQVYEGVLDGSTILLGASSLLDPGRQPETMEKEPLPFGHFIDAMGGRLLIAKDNILAFSSAFRPHLYDPRHDFVSFQSTIRLLAPTTEGVYVGDGSGVYFLSGRDPDKWEVRTVSDLPPVYGSALAVPGEDFNEELDRGHTNWLWLTRAGVQVGLPNGQVYSMHPHQLDLPQYGIASAALARYNGMKQAIFPVKSNSWLGTGTAVDSTIQ
jgi:hypothetical protein